MKILILLVSFVSSICYAQSIDETYTELSKNFISQYSNNNSDNANKIALKQLDIDPSDSTALLRLSISISQKQCIEIEHYYLQLGSRDEIQSLARAIIVKNCNFK